MNRVTIHGASDDLIELDGAISDELSAFNDESYLSFSDGTVLKISYTKKGVWEIRREQTGRAFYEHKPNDGPDGESYTDIATLTLLDNEGWVWVLYGKDFVRATRPSPLPEKQA